MKKILTPIEYDYCIKKAGRIASVAARFAVKEALFKALPDERQIGIGWHDIEVVNDTAGHPRIKCYGALKDLADQYNVYVSISHSRTSAIAMIVLEKK